eukprot:IDg15516t1
MSSSSSPENPASFKAMEPIQSGESRVSCHQAPVSIYGRRDQTDEDHTRCARWDTKTAFSNSDCTPERRLVIVRSPSVPMESIFTSQCESLTFSARGRRLNCIFAVLFSKKTSISRVSPSVTQEFVNCLQARITNNSNKHSTALFIANP